MQLEREAAYEALRLAKEKAEAANRAKSGFLATMSHELRTPLNAIIGFSEMMLREVLGALGNEQYRTYVADIHDSGTHLLQIINDILDLSKAEAGKLDLHEEVFDLRDTIHSVRQLIGARICDGGLSDSVELPADLPLLRADERKTKQVLLNLVINAVKFTPVGRPYRDCRPVRPGNRADADGKRYRHRHRARAISPACSNPSSRSIPRSAGRIRAPGWACRWSRRSWSCMAAPSRSTARSAWEPR